MITTFDNCSGIAATVVSSNSRTIELKTGKARACSRCQSGQGCGLGLLGADRGDGKIVLDSDCAVSSLPPPGSRVVLSIPEQILSRFILASLFLPAVCLVLAVIAGQELALALALDPALGALAGILTGIGGGAFIARTVGRKLHRQFKPAVQLASVKIQEMK